MSQVYFDSDSNTKNQLVKIEQDGIEYYTDFATGESGMSISGLARACGKDQSTVTRLLQSLMHKAPSECLKFFVGKDLTLMYNASNNAKIIKDTVCAAIIAHYALLKSPEAIQTLTLTSAIGIRTYIQEITGYKAQPIPPTATKPKKSLEQVETMMSIAPTFREMLVKMGMDRGLASQSVFRGLALACPDAVPLISEAANEMGVLEAAKENFLSATNIGKFLEEKLGTPFSGRKINQMLANKGWIKSKPGGKGWMLTDTGKVKGILKPVHATNGYSGQEIHWRDFIVDELLQDLQIEQAA